MEAAGLISRRVDPHDNRFTLVSLTKAGQQTLEESSPLLLTGELEISLVALGLVLKEILSNEVLRRQQGQR